ncbi:MAG: fibrobacter succinogenes major paralogous domain-containing protein [Muribaculaceae bacterium]|nr:fibrobacter succinogenes major paralogous domain-containing protein [Muribaculaceae bacterium]
MDSESRPGAALENVSTLKRWLFGIAVVSLIGVLTLLILDDGERTPIHSKESKTRKERSGYAVKGVINGKEWIDLGLPSGVRWAACNVGADGPEGFGDYYAWGEIETKDEYIDINSLTHRKNAKWLREHGIIDENDRLTPEHDIAALRWGKPWRMPTDEEYEELLDCCSFEFTSCNGVNGYLATGPNNQTIFFAAAGFKQGSEAEYTGDYGDYWSSTVVPDLIGAACSLGYSSKSYGRRRYARFAGRCVRPVTD